MPTNVYSAAADDDDDVDDESLSAFIILCIKWESRMNKRVESEETLRAHMAVSAYKIQGNE